MLSGTTPAAELAAHAPTMSGFDVAPVELTDAVVLHAMYELPYASRTEVLPPGLHPTNPPTLTIVAWRADDTPWGPCSAALVRIGCRSGVRPRGMSTRMVVTSAEAAEALAAGWGYPAAVGAVRLDRRYDATSLEVELDGDTVLTLDGSAGTALAGADLRVTDTVNLAHTPRGLRLVQAETELDLQGVERLATRLGAFDATAWGQPQLDPYHPVAAAVGRGTVVLPGLRYVCRPDELAFSGTEPVTEASRPETVA